MSHTATSFPHRKDMTHGEIFIEIAPSVLPFLVNHTWMWTTNKHGYRGQGSNCKTTDCKCCLSEFQYKFAPCVHCAAAWRLCVISKVMKGIVIANAKAQRRSKVPRDEPSYDGSHFQIKESNKGRRNGRCPKGCYQSQRQRDACWGTRPLYQYPDDIMPPPGLDLWQETCSNWVYPPPRKAMRHHLNRQTRRMMTRSYCTTPFFVERAYEPQHWQ